MKGSVLYFLVFISKGEELLVAIGVAIGVEIVGVAMRLDGEETVCFLLAMTVLSVIAASETSVRIYGEMSAEGISNA